METEKTDTIPLAMALERLKELVRTEAGHITYFNDDLNAVVAAATEEMRQRKDAAYEERNRVVAVLSKLWPSHLSLHPENDTKWDLDWRTIVCIHSPEGQLTWHVHRSHLFLFTHLEWQEGHWDGHTTKEKYERVGRLSIIPQINAEYDSFTVSAVRWLRGMGYDDAANAMAELHVEDRALRGLKGMVFVEQPEKKPVAETVAPATGHVLANVRPERAEILSTLNALDEEGFMFLAVQMWQVSKSAGGFGDKAGFARLRAAGDKLFEGQK